jgi:hypothetical protein
VAELGLAPKGGGGQGNRSQAQTRVCGSDDRWQGVHSSTKRTAFPSLRSRARSKPPQRGHGGAADKGAMSWRGPAQEKGTKGPASPSRLGCARAGVYVCARGACLHGRARERERAGVGRRRRPGRRWHTTSRRTRKGTQTARARW